MLELLVIFNLLIHLEIKLNVNLLVKLLELIFLLNLSRLLEKHLWILFKKALKQDIQLSIPALFSKMEQLML